MKLDSEQKRILKVALPVFCGYWVGYPLLMWLFGKLESFGDALIYLGLGLIISLIMTGIYVLGSKIPKKDD